MFIFYLSNYNTFKRICFALHLCRNLRTFIKHFIFIYQLIVAVNIMYTHLSSHPDNLWRSLCLLRNSPCFFSQHFFSFTLLYTRLCTASSSLFMSKVQAKERYNWSLSCSWQVFTYPLHWLLAFISQIHTTHARTHTYNKHPRTHTLTRMHANSDQPV